MPPHHPNQAPRLTTIILWQRVAIVVMLIQVSLGAISIFADGLHPIAMWRYLSVITPTKRMVVS